ncbi:GGDEF domain-containing protein [Vibrio sp. VB16]|uniref:GGDEF domain-containing protein n=1 Tax=Vibrio sp. VB16 TaxID=2785746 RepID=UPI00189E7499|nr:GGDEF domain-containing protein [Vibrio sp. VB16]UGA57105.1 GGDEF domain-containing protein [Vibrio sp. VB16]
MSFIHSNLFRLLFPLILTVIIFIGINNVTLLVQTNIPFASQLPYFLFAICILLCQSFNQGRIGMVAIAMAAAYWVIQTRLQSSLSTGTTQIEFLILAFTFPTACITVYLFPEKRFFTLSSALYIAIVAILFGWSVLTVQFVESNGLNQTWQNILFVIPEISLLPLIIILYSLLLVGLFAIMVLRYNRPIDVAVYSSLCISTLTFIFFQYPFISSILFSLGGVLLTLGVISTSHELAYIDQLTNIPGRRALDTELKHLGKKYTIAMLDVDHFKKFNDTYGHDTGDDVLKLVASLMANTNGKAKVYRYGGEEFTVLFKNKYQDETIDHLEELRERIADYEMILRNLDDRPKNDKNGVTKRSNSPRSGAVSVTISIGVADSFDTRNPKSVLKAADEALYRAKEGGRNRVSN